MASSEDDSYYIICEDVFKIYKIADLEVVALRGLDLRVRKGELVAIVGASGSGKSTLLNILGGLDSPTAGKVVVGTRDLLKMPARDLVKYRRRDVGFVWQQTGRNLIPYLTAFQNVELPLNLLGWPQKKSRLRAEEMLEAVGLAGRTQHRPERLSGGEQQRVAIAVALAHNPPLLLADEPTGELDSQSAASILDVFHSLNETYGVTIVIVTHDISITGKVQRVVTIRDGRTSLEAVRGPKALQPEAEPQEAYEEFVVLDGVGRLQIPREYVDKLRLKGRVKVLLEEDHVTVWPEESNRRVIKKRVKKEKTKDD
jgi:ABC-type lipoprotein export system ATPase subunit